MTYSYAIIGAGAITRRGHLPALKKIEDVEIIAIADINEKAAKKVAKEFDIPIYSNDYKKILNKENIDVVVVATPTPTHEKIVLDVVNAGKNVIVEKPLAMNYKQALKIYHAVTENNIKFSVVQNYRYIPSSKLVKLRILKGYLGKIFKIHGVAHSIFPSSWTRSTWLYHEGGVLYDFFPHLVDLVLWYLNFPSIKNIYAHGGDFLKYMDSINYASVVIILENGVEITLETSWIMGFLFKIIANGTGGWIEHDVRMNYYYEYHGSVTPFDWLYEFTTKTKQLIRDLLSYRFFTLPLLVLEDFHRDFLKSIEKNKREPVTIDQALKVMLVLDKALESIKNDTVIHLTNKNKYY